MDSLGPPWKAANRLSELVVFYVLILTFFKLYIHQHVDCGPPGDVSCVSSAVDAIVDIVGGLCSTTPPDESSLNDCKLDHIDDLKQYYEVPGVASVYLMVSVR
jgi:hypothetical protein